MLVYRGIGNSTNSGIQKQQYPAASGNSWTCLVVFGVGIWRMKQSYSPQLVAEIGSLWCTKLALLSWDFVAQGLYLLQQSLNAPLIIYFPGNFWWKGRKSSFSVFKSWGTLAQVCCPLESPTGSVHLKVTIGWLASTIGRLKKNLSGLKQCAAVSLEESDSWFFQKSKSKSRFPHRQVK